MTLHKIKDFDPNYRDYSGDSDIVGFDLYSGNDKIGSVDDVLVDDEGEFRYLVVHTGLWILGKKVLLPIGSARVEFKDHRVYAKNLTKAQVESLPQYDENNVVDYDHEEQVRKVYRPAATTAAYDRSSYGYDRDPDLYNLNEADHQSLKLYQERLVTSKTRRKSGEVTIGKHIETETARVSVPIEKERVVIERTSGTGQAVVPSATDFVEGEIARVEVYEEVPDVRKEAFVREEIRVQKVVDHDTVTSEEQVRREELDLNVDGNPTVDKGVNTKR
ncbi:DUF2382 domain-containing protein [Cyanobacteria bacterium FACHB-63]|nr:DUF2382 domain-containing protein [Cyanobacteria bacterium FACHB-63]